MREMMIVEWSEVRRRQPGLAAVAEERLFGPGVVLVATIRRDGTPRISPVEPYLLDERLLLGMLWGSRKAADLDRDPRVLVHSVITGRDGAEGEVKLRGTAVPITDDQTQRRWAEGVTRDLGWANAVPGRFHLFEVRTGTITHIRYAEGGDQHIATWPPAREQVRRGTSSTTVGAPETVHDLLLEEP